MADPTKGTAITLKVDPANTVGTSAATYTAGANSLLLCGVTYDDNGSGTTVSSIVVSGSPSYSTAWAQLPVNGRVFDSGQLGTELWRAVTSSGFTNQTITVTISSSERFACVAQSYTNVDTTTPIPASNSAKALTVNVTTSGNDRSLYAGVVGEADNTGRTVTAGSGYTVDGSVNYASEASVWTHHALESKNAVVTPAATTTVNFTTAPGTATFNHIIAVEIKGGTAAATGHRLTALGVGT